MSNPHFRFKINNKMHTGRLNEPELKDGHIPLWLTVPGASAGTSDRLLVEIKPDAIISMNTEAGHWLEGQGVAIPGHIEVYGTGYGADIKIEHWKETHKSDGR